MSTHRHAETLADRAKMVVVRSMIKLAGPPENGPEGRPAYDTLLSKLSAAEGVTYEPAVVGGVPGWWCHPETRDGGVLLHLHGGAYVIGSAWAYRHFAGQIARRAQASAFVADYALAPERPFPAAFDDAVAVYRALAARTERIAIVGDSAGGGLALALMNQIAHDSALSRCHRPCAGVLLSPWTDLTLSGESINARADRDPLLSQSALTDAAKCYLGDVPPTEPRASPLFGELSGLPPLLIHVGADEILLDDSLRVARRIEDVGGTIEVHEWDGMIHVFPSGFSDLAAAAEALDGMGVFLAECLTAAPEDGPELFKPATMPDIAVTAIDHVVVNVRDVEASAAWYETALGMARRVAQSADGLTRTSMVFGPNKINLRPISASQDEWFTAQIPGAGSDDLCFLTDAGPDDVVQHFRGLGVAIVTGPVTRSGAQGSICSVYVRDPDGNLIEVSSYP